MRLFPALRISVWIAALCLCVQGQNPPGKDAQINETKGMPPRATPADYQAQAQAGTVTVAAEFTGHSVATMQGTFSTEDYVVVEVANALCRIPFRETAVKLINSMQADKNIEMIEIDSAIYNQAWILYSDRPDKEWSLTDCASFVVMKQKRIAEAFTTDKHFEQAGFTILLKD